ncbi:DUF6012 family protein [Pseudomonas aeruginosa]|uniref:DUF6012 family protein n=1 Tax=Pseudomonas aeruginosa TaxID=287 RepID=UPI000EAE83E9|nr:DUF6012 family protein [Pseudomonas aeruginosa]HCE5941742.1 hypothetical protein [Pseudomonas aeruginosa]
MLIHIAPRLLVPRSFSFACELIDVRVKEFGLLLAGGHDVVARQPFPNKRYYVACRNKGRKATKGLLIDVPGQVPYFTVITRWKIAGEIVVQHRVEYVVLDDEFDAVTDDPVLWNGLCFEMGDFPNRVTDVLLQQAKERGCPLGLSSPRATFEPPSFDDRTRRPVSPVEICEQFRMPTIEPGRLLPRDNDIQSRLPSRELAFVVRAEEVNYG